LNVITPPPALRAGGDQSQGKTAARRPDEKADTLGGGLFLFPVSISDRLAGSIERPT